MKKLNLLLATTAILSMGAMAVNAEGTPYDPSTGIIIPVSVVFETFPRYFINHPLSFGWLWTEAGTITVSATGADPVSSITYLGGAERADIEWVDYENNMSIVLPDNEHPVELTNKDESTCGTVNNFTQSTVKDDASLTRHDYIGGTLNVLDGVEPGNCSGDLVVTVVINNQ